MTLAPSLRLQVKRLRKEFNMEGAPDYAEQLRLARLRRQSMTLAELAAHRRDREDRWIDSLNEPDAPPYTTAELYQQARRRAGRRVLAERMADSSSADTRAGADFRSTDLTNPPLSPTTNER